MTRIQSRGTLAARLMNLTVRFYLLSICAVTGTVVVGTVNVEAQTGSVPVGNYTTMVGIYFTVASPATCSDSTTTLPDGGYVKPSTTIHIDAEGTAGGTCQFWFFDTHYPQYDSNRYVSALGGTYTLPDASYQAMPYYPGSSVNDYDTRSPGSGNGYRSAAPTQLGKHTVSLQSYGANVPSDCNSPATSALMTRSFNVVSCQPLFNIDSNYPTVISRLQPTNIDVYLPTSMADLAVPLAGALADYNTALSGTGLHFNDASSTDCGTGATCVRFAEGSTGSFCAQQSPNFNTSTGYFSSNIIVTLSSSTWRSAGGSRQQRTVAHELGHLVGLDDNSGCAATDSVMRNGVYACDDTDSGVAHDPTINDTLPSKSTAYNGGTKTACGF